MKRTYNVFIFFYILLIVVYFNTTLSLAKNSEDLVKTILQKTSGNVVEYGLKYELDSKDNGEEVVVNLFSKLPLQRETLDVKVIKDSFQYCIEFKTDGVKGYVQYMIGMEKKIMVSIVEEKDLENISEHKSKIESIIKDEGLQFRCFEYVKAITSVKDAAQAKEIVETTLKKSGASNTSCININKGYSITAYTGKGEQMKMGNELIDINCAIRSYDSGIYVIVGTPVISTCY
jgi:hypothetical protein